MFPWEELYINAVFEPDNSLLADRIKVAEETIQRRLWKMPRLQENEEERKQAEHVLASLAVLREERLSRAPNL